jgi:hypothetical protein
MSKRQPHDEGKDEKENFMNDRNTMNRYLVVALWECETIPLRLCSTREHALEFIAGADEQTVSSTLTRIYQRKAQSYLGVVSMAVIDFRNGKPLGCDVIRSLEGEPVKVQLERIWKELGLRKEGTESGDGSRVRGESAK